MILLGMFLQTQGFDPKIIESPGVGHGHGVEANSKPGGSRAGQRNSHPASLDQESQKYDVQGSR